MQVFIIGSPLDTAVALDRRRLNKQIIECRQILNAIDGKTKSWANHPCTIQYREYRDWLEVYLTCLEYYVEYLKGDKNIILDAYVASEICVLTKPNFHTQEYFDNMKKRLYTKDHSHYKQFEVLGESYENWYWVDNKWKIYKQK